MVQGVERPQHIRPDDHPGGEIAEHGADAEIAAQRRGNGGSGQKHRYLNKLRLCHICRVPSADSGYHANARLANAAFGDRPVPC